MIRPHLAIALTALVALIELAPGGLRAGQGEGVFENQSVGPAILESTQPEGRPAWLNGVNSKPDRAATFVAQDLPDSIRRLPPAGQAEEIAPPLPVEPPATGGLPHDNGRFPSLPPAPPGSEIPPLPPLETELWTHGGSYLYQPEGDRLNWPESHGHDHFQVLRLPECWQAPQPLTLIDDFLGTGPIAHSPKWHWPGCGGYTWDPGIVLYGSYELLGIALEADNQRRDLIGHQMFVDLDIRLTGTERFHVQWQPLGKNNTGGSYYQFSDPPGYVDNSTFAPELFWFEGEIASIFSGLIHDPFIPRDYHVVVGQFPLQMHNRLLISDNVLGVVVNKNTIYLGDLSNLNIQGFYAFDDIRGLTSLYGINATADWRHVLFELTYAYGQNSRAVDRDAQWAALSATKLCGATTIAGRALFKWGDQGGRGAGQLFVVEANRTRLYDHGWFGIEKAVFYANAFRATKGWNSISGGNFNRLRTAFAVNPLVVLSARRDPDDNVGVTLGAQFFRHHEDESVFPEISFDAPDGQPVLGVGVTYQRKTGKRSFFEIQGIGNFSDDPRFRREGVFVSQSFLF